MARLTGATVAANSGNGIAATTVVTLVGTAVTGNGGHGLSLVYAFGNVNGMRLNCKTN
jgi:hypothetical protein